MTHSNSHSPDPWRTIAEISELAGGLAHELRNPLSTIMVNLQLLAEDLRDPTAHAEDVRRRALLRIEVLQREAGRLQSLFDEFLSLTSPYHLERTEVNVHETIKNLLEFYRPQAEARGIAVEERFAGEPLTCRADETLLRSALLNIIINAQEAMPQGGNLTVATEQTEKCVRISISDTGVGIDQANRDEILRPFFSTKSSGTGLGLSISQRIIHEHGGELTFESKPEMGTTFFLELPRTSSSRTT